MTVNNNQFYELHFAIALTLLISRILQLLRSKCAALVQKTEVLDNNCI